MRDQEKNTRGIARVKRTCRFVTRFWAGNPCFSPSNRLALQICKLLFGECLVDDHLIKNGE